MRAFGHALQPQAVLALAKFFANNVLFSYNASAMRISAMVPRTFRAHNKLQDTQSALFQTIIGASVLFGEKYLL